MKPFPLPASTATFVLKHILILAFMWVLFGLALFGLFAPLLVGVLAGAWALALAFFAWKHFPRMGHTYRLVLLVVTLFVAWVSLTVTPSIFSGRDQGSLAEAAIRLAQTGGLPFATQASEAFFQHYGPGLALNFPGFAYAQSGALLTQFPLPYIAWLAAFFSLFGLSGLIVANAVLFLLSLTVLYRLLHLRVMTPVALGVTALFGLSFLPLWLFKLTLSENLALYLFLLLSYALILLTQERKFTYYALALLSATLLCFTRIEGFLILPLALMVMAWLPNVRQIWRLYPIKSLLVPALLFCFIFLRDFFINLPFYKTIGKALVRFGRDFGPNLASSAEAGSSLQSALALPSLFILYGLAAVCLLGFVGIFILWRKRVWPLLIPVILALPTYLYFLAPNITPDHPWLLRRFAFSVYPSLLLAATFGLAVGLGYRKTALKENTLMLRSRRSLLLLLLWVILLALQWPAFQYARQYAEHPTLLPQIAALSSRFTDHDLILIDRGVTGDGYAMPTGPLSALYGKQAVYFFNPEDLARIDTASFEHVYLLVPRENLPRYAAAFGDRMVYRETFLIETLHSPVEPIGNDFEVAFPERRLERIQNLLFEVY